MDNLHTFTGVFQKSRAHPVEIWVKISLIGEGCSIIGAIPMSNRLERVKITVSGSEIDFFYRPESIGDVGVIDQIFKNNDYNLAIFPMYKHLLFYSTTILLNNKIPLIIDAGANIGASSLYFHHIFRWAEILAIEPEKHNCEIFRINSEGITEIQLVEGGIASSDGFMTLEDPGISDWGFRLRNSRDVDGEKVNVYSINRLIKEKCGEGCIPLIIKIDIEGGEFELFSQNIEWLKCVPLIIIELHDWMLPGTANSKNFLRSISEFNFDILYRGENIFCFNNDLLLPTSELNEKLRFLSSMLGCQEIRPQNDLKEKIALIDNNQAAILIKEAAESKVAELQDKIHKLSNQNAILVDDREISHQKIMELETKMWELQHSTTWRMMGPVRYVGFRFPTLARWLRRALNLRH